MRNNETGSHMTLTSRRITYTHTGRKLISAIKIINNENHVSKEASDSGKTISLKPINYTAACLITRHRQRRPTALFVYVCVCVYMNLSVLVCAFVYVFACVYDCMRLYFCLYLYFYVLCVFVFGCVYVFECLRFYVCVRVLVCVHQLTICLTHKTDFQKQCQELQSSTSQRCPRQHLTTKINLTRNPYKIKRTRSKQHPKTIHQDMRSNRIWPPNRSSEVRE